MAKAGETIENPVTGEQVTFLQTTGDTNGELLEYELRYRPQGFVTQTHVHPKQSERHEVLEGAIGLTVDGREQRLGPGEVIDVPAATPHRIERVSDDLVRMRFQLRPALRTEQLLETFVRLARDGKVNSKGYPRLLQLAVISRDFEDEGYATRPPLAVQRALFGPLAAIARRRGYRSGY